LRDFETIAQRRRLVDNEDSRAGYPISANSAAVQPGNSGGPLLDSGGEVVGMVAAKLNALKFARATGNIPENINFAIKTGMLRDFLDNSVVPYQTADSKNELKTSDVARNARAFTLLISCTATEQSASAKK
jgi:S1-C subfamily serine protease